MEGNVGKPHPQGKSIVGSQRGQGLAEAAIFLPLLVLLLAGLVELSNLLATQNKVSTASRMAAGYGAANFDN
jgi:Flp pilus assembly protein TadG